MKDEGWKGSEGVKNRRFFDFLAQKSWQKLKCQFLTKIAILLTICISPHVPSCLLLFARTSLEEAFVIATRYPRRGLHINNLWTCRDNCYIIAIKMFGYLKKMLIFATSYCLNRHLTDILDSAFSLFWTCELGHFTYWQLPMNFSERWKRSLGVYSYHLRNTAKRSNLSYSVNSGSPSPTRQYRQMVTPLFLYAHLKLNNNPHRRVTDA